MTLITLHRIIHTIGQNAKQRLSPPQWHSLQCIQSSTQLNNIQHNDWHHFNSTHYAASDYPHNWTTCNTTIVTTSMTLITLHPIIQSTGQLATQWLSPLQWPSLSCIRWSTQLDNMLQNDCHYFNDSLYTASDHSHNWTTCNTMIVTTSMTLITMHPIIHTTGQLATQRLSSLHNTH